MSKVKVEPFSSSLTFASMALIMRVCSFGAYSLTQVAYFLIIVIGTTNALSSSGPSSIVYLCILFNISVLILELGFISNKSQSLDSSFIFYFGFFKFYFLVFLMFLFYTCIFLITSIDENSENKSQIILWGMLYRSDHSLLFKIDLVSSVSLIISSFCFIESLIDSPSILYPLCLMLSNNSCSISVYSSTSTVLSG